MSDTSPTPPVSDETKGASGAPDGTESGSSTVDRTELEDAIKRRDSALKKARKAEEELEAFKASTDSQIKSLSEQLKAFTETKKKQEDDAAVARGDIEAIRKSAEEERNALLKQLDELKSSYEAKLSSANAQVTKFRDTYLLENEVKRILSEVTVDAEAAFLLLRDKFELAEDEGTIKPRVKDSTLPIREWTERTLEQSNRHYMLKNQRKPGSGAAPEPAKSPGHSKAQSIPTDLASWSKADRLKWIRENPELAKQQRDEAMKKL